MPAVSRVVSMAWTSIPRDATIGVMACRMTEVVLDAHDPERLASFWCEVLGWVVIDRDQHEVEIGPSDSSGAGAPRMVLLRSIDTKTQKLRLHLDLRPTDSDHADELARLVAAGAVPADIGQGDAVRWAVLADPEGNEFCLLHPVESLALGVAVLDACGAEWEMPVSSYTMAGEDQPRR